jgi:hypothetical protein
MYAIYGNICHQYTPNVSIYTIHGSYGHDFSSCELTILDSSGNDPFLNSQSYENVWLTIPQIGH